MRPTTICECEHPLLWHGIGGRCLYFDSDKTARDRMPSCTCQRFVPAADQSTRGPRMSKQPGPAPAAA